MTEIHEHAGSGNLIELKRTLTTVPVDQQNMLTGASALHYAAFEGQFDVVRVLVLEYKADLFMQNYLGDTVLHTAVKGLLFNTRLLVQSANKKDQLPYLNIIEFILALVYPTNIANEFLRIKNNRKRTALALFERITINKNYSKRILLVRLLLNYESVLTKKMFHFNNSYSLSNPRLTYPIYLSGNALYVNTNLVIIQKILREVIIEILMESNLAGISQKKISLLLVCKSWVRILANNNFWINIAGSLSASPNLTIVERMIRLGFHQLTCIYLLHRKHSINFTAITPSGRSLLFYALQRKKPMEAFFLIANMSTAQLATRDDRGDNALDLVLKSQHEVLLPFLVGKGNSHLLLNRSKLSESNGIDQKSLAKLVRFGDTKFLESLNSLQQSALHLAGEYNDYFVVMNLIERFSSRQLLLADHQMLTALEWSILKGASNYVIIELIQAIFSRKINYDDPLLIKVMMLLNSQRRDDVIKLLSSMYQINFATKQTPINIVELNQFILTGDSKSALTKLNGLYFENIGVFLKDVAKLEGNDCLLVNVVDRVSFIEPQWLELLLRILYLGVNVNIIYPETQEPLLAVIKRRMTVADYEKTLKNASVKSFSNNTQDYLQKYKENVGYLPTHMVPEEQSIALIDLCERWLNELKGLPTREDKLTYAAKCGMYGVLAELIPREPYYSVRINENLLLKALCVATENNHIEAVRVLLEASLHIFMFPDLETDRNPMQIADSNRSYRLTILFLERLRAFKIKEGNRAEKLLMLAIEYGLTNTAVFIYRQQVNQLGSGFLGRVIDKCYELDMVEVISSFMLTSHSNYLSHLERFYPWFLWQIQNVISRARFDMLYTISRDLQNNYNKYLESTSRNWWKITQIAFLHRAIALDFFRNEVDEFKRYFAAAGPCSLMDNTVMSYYAGWLPSLSEMTLGRFPYEQVLEKLLRAIQTNNQQAIDSLLIGAPEFFIITILDDYQLLLDRYTSEVDKVRMMMKCFNFNYRISLPILTHLGMKGSVKQLLDQIKEVDYSEEIIIAFNDVLVSCDVVLADLFLQKFTICQTYFKNEKVLCKQYLSKQIESVTDYQSMSATFLRFKNVYKPILKPGKFLGFFATDLTGNWEEAITSLKNKVLEIAKTILPNKSSVEDTLISEILTFENALSNQNENKYIKQYNELSINHAIRLEKS